MQPKYSTSFIVSSSLTILLLFAVSLSFFSRFLHIVTMGKPTPQTAAYRDDPDAVSLHTTPDDYSYDDAPDVPLLPPSYTDSESSSQTGGASVIPPLHHIRHIAPPTTRTDHSKVSIKNGKPIVCETLTHMNPDLDNDPQALLFAVNGFAYEAPTPYIYIMGTHRETIKKGDKKETKDITDFRIVINMQRYLRPNFNDRETRSVSVKTVENGVKTHRGTILKTRAPCSQQSIEVGNTTPTLEEWCHRFCASPRMLKIFRVERTVPGIDKTYLRNQLEGLVRATNYRGHMSITFPIEDRNVDIYTSKAINRWRLTTWIQWLFYLSFLWLFSWPILFFSTRRYAVVQAEWPFSSVNEHGMKTFTTVSEEQWFGKWKVAIRRLVLDRYQGEAGESMMQGVMERPEDPPMPGTISTGNENIDTAVGIISQGFHLARAVSGQGNGRGLQGGWGYDC